jgi:putative endonuclease
MEGGYVYIMTNKNRTVLYTGVTSNLLKRMREHREHQFPGSFTAKYNIELLVYYVHYATIEQAIEQEKIIKSGSKKKKIYLINKMNPEWEDLYYSICGF